MKSKITGFVLAPNPTHYTPEINPGLRTTGISGQWGHLTLYSTGGDIAPVRPGVWSLGFPASDSLLEHNLLISVTDDGVTIENDWLGSIPVYFNKKENIVSTFPEACLTSDTEWDDEGLYLFLKYGFSAFNTSPFKAVKPLRYFAALQYSGDEISISEKPDPVLSYDFSEEAGESEILEQLGEQINQTLDSTTGPVVSPLSGGLDSRVINFLINETHKPRVHTYSYGASPNQHKSFETAIARKVADNLGLKWKHVPLGDAYDYIDQWHDLFGFSTHMHGMYQIEFYKKIREQLAPEEPAMMFSGIGGSVFEGDHLSSLNIKGPEDIYRLTFTHDLNCKHFIPQKPTRAEQHFFDNNQQLIRNKRYFAVLMMRLKLPLLNYLVTLPAMLGIPSSAPFLNFDTAMKMLSLPQHRRNDRAWLKDFFTGHDLNYGFRFRSRHGMTRNTLNRQLFSNHEFQPLKETQWQPYVSPEKIKNINSRLNQYDSLGAKIRFFFTTQRVIKEILRRTGISNLFDRNLNCYFTLKALEKSVEKRAPKA